jgi:hypothetical protein
MAQVFLNSIDKAPPQTNAEVSSVIFFSSMVCLQIPDQFPGIEADLNEVPFVQVMLNCGLHFIPGKFQIIGGQFQGLLAHAPDYLGNDIFCGYRVDYPVRLELA